MKTHAECFTCCKLTEHELNKVTQVYSCLACSLHTGNLTLNTPKPIPWIQRRRQERVKAAFFKLCIAQGLASHSNCIEYHVIKRAA